RRTPDQPYLGQVFTSDINLLNVSFRYGWKYIYGIALAGIAGTHSVFHASFGLGFGGHIPVGPFSIDIDTTLHTFVYGGVPQSKNLMLQERAMLSWQILPHFGVFAGPTYDVSLTFLPIDGKWNDGNTLTFVGQRYYANKQLVECNWPGLVV